MIKQATHALVLAGLVTASSAAFARDAISFSNDHTLAFASPQRTVKFTPNFVKKPKQSTIFSNLASAYPKGVYFSGEGSTIFAEGGSSQFVAVGFTPAANATAAEIDVAVGNFGDGNSTYTISINADNAGLPGDALWSGPITSTTLFGDCCGLATVKIKGGLALASGTPYWVAITLSKKQQKAQDDGAWNLSTTDQVDPTPFAFNPNNSGWVSSPTTLPPAVGVFSK